LIRILGDLMKRKDRFDYIMIETTGLADPGPVAQTFFVDDEMQRKLALDGIVTVVDALHIWQHLDDSEEAREQIALADVILLNKVDLVPSAALESLETRIRRMNAVAKIYRAQNATVAVDKLLHLGRFMDVVLLPLTNASPEALAAVQMEAVLLFSAKARVLQSGGIVRLEKRRCQLRLAGKAHSFKVQIATHEVRELAWDHTSRYLATGSGPVVVVWDYAGKGPQSSKPLMLEAHEDFLSGLAFQHTGPLLASGGIDGRVVVWQPGQARQPLTQNVFGAGITQLVWSPDDPGLALGSEVGTVAVLRLK
jgi:hypothetical protein